MPKDKKIKGRLAAAALAVFSLLALSAAVYLLFSPIDLTRFSGKIESVVEARTGRRVLFESIVVKALPEPDITLKGLRVFQGEDLLMTAKSLRVKLSGLPFPGRKTVIDNLDVSGPVLFVKRDRSGALNLSGVLKGLPGGKGGPIIRSLDFRDGLISITDYAPAGPVSYTVSGVNAKISESKNGFAYGAKGTLLPASDISLSGEGTKDEIAGTGSIKNLELEKLNPYISGDGGEFVKGTAEFDLSYAYGASPSLKGVIRYRDLTASMSALDRPVRSESGTALVALTQEKNGSRDLDITEARLMVNGLMVSGDLRLAGMGANPYFTLNASTTEAPFKSFKDLVPVNTVNRRAADVIKAITPIGGTLTVRKFSAQGPLEAVQKGRIFQKPVDISCDVSLDGLRYRYRGLSKTFSGLTGGLSLKNGVLTFKGSAAYDRIGMDGITWELRDLPGRLSFTLKLSSSGDTSDILEKIREFTRAKALDKVRASGFMDVDFSLEGELAGAKRYSIDTTVRDGTFSYAGLPLNLSSLNGGVSFDNDRITFRKLHGTDGRSAVVLDGYINDWLGTAPYFDMAGQGDLSKETVAPFIRNTAFDRLSVAGTVAFKGTVKGTKEKISSSVSVNTTGAEIEYGSFLRKARPYPLSAEGSVELSGRELAVKNLRVAFGQSAIDLDGTVSLDKRLFNLRARSKGVRIADIGNVSPYLAEESRADGLVTFDMRAGRTANESSYEGTVRIKDGRFKTPLIAKRIERINASAQFTGNDAVITIENITVGGSEVTGTVNIPDVAGRVVIFDLFSPRLYVEDFAGLKEGEKAPRIPKATHPVAPRQRSGEKTIIGMGRIIIRDGGAWGHAFHDFSADVRISDGAAYFKPIAVAIDQGAVTGTAAYYASATEPLLFETDLRINGADLEKMITAFGPGDEFLSGSLNGRLSISAKRGASPFTSGLNGEASLRTDKGKLWQFLFFTKIFSVVNVFSINEIFRTGLPYKTISGDFYVKDGIISTDNLIFDSHSMRMSAVGKISLPGRSIESVIAVKPFVTIDYILSQIPLAGWIIQGKEKSALSMYFDVKGPVRDPQVTPVTVTGVGKGILGIVQRLIETPIKIIKPDLE